MVHTRGGHRSKPRGQTSTPTRNGAGTSRAAVGHSPAQDTESPPIFTPDATMMQSPAFAAIPEEPQGAEPHPRDTTPGWALAPPLLCIPNHPRGHRLLSEPRHLAQGSLRGLGPSLPRLQLLRVHRLSYPRPRGLGVPYLVVTRYPGTWTVMPRTSTESRTTTCQHWQRTRDS